MTQTQAPDTLHHSRWRRPATRRFLMAAAVVICSFVALWWLSSAAGRHLEEEAEQIGRRLPLWAGVPFAGILLSIARVAGETAPLLFTSFNNNFFSTDMNRPIASLTVTIFQYAMGPYQSWHAQAWGAALVITLFILILTIAGRFILKWRYKQ